MNNIVKNSTQGYGYKYASLADIAEQGYEIPLMKTGTENGKEYVYWLRKNNDQEEWLRGAEIVIPQSKGMNDAQIYGSALTYARRYTVLMADMLATDDDVLVEKEEKIFDEPTPADVQTYADEFRELFDAKKQTEILNGYGVLRPEDMDFVVLQAYVNKKKNEKQTNKGKGNQPGN